MFQRWPQAQKTTPNATPIAEATTMSTVRQRAEAGLAAEVSSVLCVVVVIRSLLSVADGAAVL